MGRPLASLGAIVLALSLGACGDSGSDDSGPATFEEDGFPFTFEYPSSWDEASDVTVNQTLGPALKQTAAVTLDESNGIIVENAVLKGDVTAQNLAAVKPQFDRIVQQVDPQATGEAGQVAGFPSLTYQAVPITRPAGRQEPIDVPVPGRQRVRDQLPVDAGPRGRGGHRLRRGPADA